MIKLNSFFSILLFPISKLWELAYYVRRSLYEYGILKKDIFQVPVCSVGNLTFGGTGKTPFIIYLTKYLQENNKVPLVLTRGYKGELENHDGIIIANKRLKANPVDFGDEPLLIANRLETGAVVVGKKRSQNLKKYFHLIRPDVVLLDDGYQHLQIYRTFNIALFDATLPLEKLIAPYHYHKIPVSRVQYIVNGLYDIYSNKISEANELKDRNVICLAALASPESFFELVQSFGAKIISKEIFPDHYYFTKNDISRILHQAAENSALIITSEKDMVKIRKVSQDAKICYLGIEIDFINGEREFLTQVNKRLFLES